MEGDTDEEEGSLEVEQKRYEILLIWHGFSLALARS